MLVAFHLPRRPLSSSAKLSQGYMAAIADVARSAYAGPIAPGPLYSRIIWFHKYQAAQGDTDNIMKKVHDALTGVLFDDDRVITHAMAVRVDATLELEIVADPANPDPAQSLAESLAEAHVRDVLYVEIGMQINRRVQLGPLL